MSVARQFLLSLLESDDQHERRVRFRRAVDAGVREDSFFDDLDRRAWNFIAGHYGRYRQLPSLAVVETEVEIDFPEYAPEEPFDFWVDRLVEFQKHVYLHEAAAEVIELLETSTVDAAEQLLTQAGHGLGRFRKRGQIMTATELAEQTLDAHDRLQRGEVSPGIPCGFPYIDAITGGAQAGDSWVIVGRPAAGKSFVACHIAQTASTAELSPTGEIIQPGRRVMFVSMEMPSRQISQRTLAMGARVSATPFRLGRLSYFAMQRLRQHADRLRATGDGDNLLIVEGRLNMSVDDLLMLVREYSPEILIADGAYLIKPSARLRQRAHWEAAMLTMEGLKQLAMDENLPVLSTYQFNRKGAKSADLDSIAYTDAAGQLASVVIGIQNDDGMSVRNYSNEAYKLLTLMKGRNGEVGEIRVRYDMQRTVLEEAAVIRGDESVLMGRRFHGDEEELLEDFL